MTCAAQGCTNPETNGWQRWATLAEVNYYHETGDLPASESSARLLVYACAEHKLTPPEMMTVTHDMDCTAPPTCDCSVHDNPPNPAGSGEDEGHAP